MFWANLANWTNWANWANIVFELRKNPVVVDLGLKMYIRGTILRCE